MAPFFLLQRLLCPVTAAASSTYSDLRPRAYTSGGGRLFGYGDQLRVLGLPCEADDDCSSLVRHTECREKYEKYREGRGDRQKICACEKHYHNFRNQECLPGKWIT